jgi:hypothetical protein
LSEQLLHYGESLYGQGEGADDDGDGDIQMDDADGEGLGDEETRPQTMSRSPPAPTRVDYHPNPGFATEIYSSNESTCLKESDAYLRDPWYPFVDQDEYILARWMIECELPKDKIDLYFNQGSARFPKDDDRYFRSASGLWKKINKMANSELLEFTKKDIDYGVAGVPPSPMYYRDPLNLLTYILRQPAYSRDLVWNAVREYDENENQVYSELHTADWWWNEQVSVFNELANVC